MMLSSSQAHACLQHRRQTPATTMGRGRRRNILHRVGFYWGMRREEEYTYASRAGATFTAIL
ncbi:hypothetical protein N172_10875 [Pantoea dispersa EGD-AAK13]|nr:hypothetical protein N172_10875 [Pantoea dispersa EGD-AAK13]KTS16991.1 hypothetical protein NS215_08975 [Pantoea dispersa]KTS33792.1 hypothetical protein NS389_11435 [Pantoea dispersa]KTS56985.1 hypothetical protein NS380_15115 [Pantoea dispersa]KTS88523.1 hypothetical protein RSA31_08120 [Pantoea dispersa]